MRIGIELMEFTVTNSATRTISITSRGYGGTSPVSYADGMTATSIDNSNIENCIADVTQIIRPYGTQTDNITNAAYAAL